MSSITAKGHLLHIWEICIEQVLFQRDHLQAIGTLKLLRRVSEF